LGKKKAEQEKDKIAKKTEQLENSIFPVIYSKMVQMIVFINSSYRMELEQV